MNLLSDGALVLATTGGDPLRCLVRPDGVAGAGEPWPAPRWVEVPDRHLVEAPPDHLTVHPLKETR